jgi:hypothetical protein
MDLAVVLIRGERSEVVHTTVLGKEGSYRNRGIYGRTEDAVAALQEFKSAHTKCDYMMVPASSVAHQNDQVYKWEVFPEFDEDLYPEGEWDRNHAY